jgi:hypothetical protein
MRRMEDRVRQIELVALAVGALVLLVLFAISRFG